MNNKTEKIWETLRININRWFPDRQILVRGPDRLSSLMLSQRRQVLCVAAVLVTLLWAGSASIGLACAMRAAGQAAQREHQVEANAASAQAKITALTASYAIAERQRDQAVAQADEARDIAVAQADNTRDTAVAQARLVVASNTATLGQLAARTQDTIGQVEIIIKSTGLSLDRMAQAPAKAGDNEAPKAVEEAGTAGATPVPPGMVADAQTSVSVLWQDLGRLKSLAALLEKLPLSAPVAQISITSPFGPRADPFTGAPEFHVGVDLRGDVGTPVFATAPGVVSFAGAQTGYGNLIEIEHGFGLSTRYSHLQKIFVSVGSSVDLHQEIGLLGNTGWSTGPHLLYETRVDGQPQNPLNFIKVTPNGVQN